MRRPRRGLLDVLRWVLFAATLAAMYIVGFAYGQRSAVVQELHQQDCRANLAGPVNDARDRAQVAFNYALPAYVAGDDPMIATELRRAIGENVDVRQIARDQVVDEIRANKDFADAAADRGPDPEGRCEDGNPDHD